MRMYGFLNTPRLLNRQDLIYKVMLHEIRQEGVFAYLYTRPEALFCSFDLHYTSLEDALEDWEGEIDGRGWTPLDDPLPGCQHDCPLPVRVKGRDQGAPQWGQYEILEHGKWKDFTP